MYTYQQAQAANAVLLLKLLNIFGRSIECIGNFALKPKTTQKQRPYYQVYRIRKIGGRERPEKYIHMYEIFEMNIC